MDPPLSIFSLTYVQFNSSDPISYACAWLALLPQALCVTYVVLLWSTREVEIALMGAGQFACEVLNWTLKRVIREERPPQMLGKGYGMPSSHAQFLAYFATYTTLFLLLRHRPYLPSSSTSTSTSLSTSTAEFSSSAPTTSQRPFSYRATAPQPTHILFSLFLLSIAASTAASRVYLSYHTPRQVGAGSAAGAVCAVAWFGATSVLRRRGWVDYALSLWVARAFRVRDLLGVMDLPEAGWRVWAEEGGVGGVSGVVVGGGGGEGKKRV